MVLSALLPQNGGMFGVSPSDHGIKLFGKTIPAPAETQNAAQPADIEDEFHGECDEDDFSPRGVHDELGASSGSGSGSEEEDCRGFSMNEGKEHSEVPDFAEKLQGSSNNSSSTIEGKEKTSRRLHKPIPCPRCQSLDTKFCYFNNYNVNQPRHFCKHCQRYWTAGGTLRNVPVGAGKRKCKQSSAQQSHSFASHSVVCRRDDTGEGQSLRSCSLPEPSLQSASHIPICVGKDGSCSSSSMRSHTPLLGTVSSNGASRPEWVPMRRDSLIDFQSHSRGGYTGYSNDTTLKASTTEGTELSPCSSSDLAPAIENVSNSISEESTFHSAQSCARPENSSSTQILPVLAGPWPVLYHMYWTQIPRGAPTPTYPLCPSPLSGPSWTVQSILAPCATANNSLGTSTAQGKRPAEESVEGSSPSIPKTSRIDGSKAAASTSSLPTVGMEEMRPQSSTSTGFSTILKPEAANWKVKSVQDC